MTYDICSTFYALNKYFNVSSVQFQCHIKTVTLHSDLLLSICLSGMIYNFKDIDEQNPL